MSDIPLSSKYIQSSQYCDSNNLEIQKITERLTKDIPEEDKLQQAINLFYFVRDQIKYVAVGDRNYYSRKNLKASSTLKRGYGYCIQKSVLLVTLARSKGIPARLHFVDIRNYLTPVRFLEKLGRDLFIYHGFAELFLNNKWIQANVAFDKDLCLKKGYPIGEFDGVADCKFSNIDDQGRKFVEYVKDRGTNAEVPYCRILWTWFIEYGLKRTKTKK